MRLAIQSMTADLLSVIDRIRRALTEDFDKGANGTFADIVGSLATLQPRRDGLSTSKSNQITRFYSAPKS